jgi:hypothetical protein
LIFTHQPVLIQSFVEKFELPKCGEFFTPPAAGQILIMCDQDGMFNEEHQSIFERVLANCVLTRWSRPDIQNVAHELPCCDAACNEVLCNYQW